MAALCRGPPDGARVRGDIQKSIPGSSLDLNTSRLLSTSLLGWLKPHQDPDRAYNTCPPGVQVFEPVWPLAIWKATGAMGVGDLDGWWVSLRERESLLRTIAQSCFQPKLFPDLPSCE